MKSATSWLRSQLVWTTLSAVLLSGVSVNGQVFDFEAASDPTAASEANGAAGLNIPNFQLRGLPNETEEPLDMVARYFVDANGKGRIELEATLDTKWYLYSTTQKPGGPTPTKLTVLAPENVRVVGEFTPDQDPSKGVSSTFGGLVVEKHTDRVVWSAPIEAPAGFQDEVDLNVKAQICKGSDNGPSKCMPVSEVLVAAYAGTFADNPFVMAVADGTLAEGATEEEAAAAKKFRDQDYVVEWEGVVSSSQVAAGESGSIKFTAVPDKGFHVYVAAVDDADSSTNFVVTEKSGLKVGAPKANQPVITKSILPSLPPVSYYKGKVTWTLPIEIPAGTPAGEKKLEGYIGYQACTDDSCMRPTALKFTAMVTVADSSNNQAAGLEMVNAKRAVALDEAATVKWVDEVEADQQRDKDDDQAAVPAGDGGSTSFPILLGLAFMGGLILNVMPCVLPVVGLKIMGFVSQAGEDRGRVFVLNLVYVAGIMAIFAVLGAVAAVSKFGWGEQFTYFPVKLTLTLLMFALALSYLGVWEIPAPGMAGGKASQDLQSREGLSGAFAKGVFATILATPCSGPLLGYILGLTLKLSGLHTFTIFMAVGLGMSFPYLVIGAKPSLISWLPKPGDWMETLKQLMAFLFLGTVAFFFAQFGDKEKVPVFVCLIGVWFGCWIIGRTPNWESLDRRIRSWAVGIVAATVIGVWAFTYLIPRPVLAWEDYNEARLQQLRSQGRTVLVDFGAKWCGTCIYNYETAINTQATREVVDELGAIAMYADWTDYNEAIKSKLEELDSRSIPLLAIYPGSRPNEPIILRDLVTQNDVVDALREAGASQSLASGPGSIRTVAADAPSIASTNR